MKKLLFYGILGVFLLGLVLVVLDVPPPTPAASTSPPAPSALKTDSETQQKRENLIRKLVEQGVFYKTEVTGTLPKLWIAPGFYALAFEEKQKFVSVVAAYYLAQSPRWNIIVLKDSRTGKPVGQFDQRGLRLE